MKYHSIGKSGLKVSQVCLGSNNFGGQVNEDSSIRIIKRAIDNGVNLIDTANTYTGGKSEQIIGKAVQGNRDELVLATKVGNYVGQGPNYGGLSRKHILWQIKRSLERLQTDFIDIYYLHRFDEETPLQETLQTLNTLVREGRVRYIACSNFMVNQIAQAHEICMRLGLEKFIALQVPYNLLQRDIERELLPYCQEQGLGVLTYSPLLGGFLTGKYLTNASMPSGSRGEFSQRYFQSVTTKKNFSFLEKIRSVADSAHMNLLQLAVCWTLKNPSVASIVIGASRIEQIEESCRVVEMEMPDEIYWRLNEITKSDYTGSH